MAFRPFSNISKRASHKAPSFFDSAYHLRNYTQVVGPDHFNSNTKENQESSYGKYPHYKNGIYSFCQILDPCTSSYLLNHAGNNNGNNNNNNGPNASNAAFLEEPVHNKYAKKRRNSGSMLAPFARPFISNVSELQSLMGKRAFSSLADEEASKAQTGDANADVLMGSTVLTSEDVFTQSTISEAELAVIQSATKEVSYNEEHAQILEAQIAKEPADGSIRKSLLSEIKNCVMTGNYLKIYPVYQAMKRNDVPIELDEFKIILYYTAAREIPGESIESRLTNILNVYSDLISRKLKPDSEVYEIVLDNSLDGSFKAFDIFRNNDGIEKTIDDNGKVFLNEIDNGANYFKLALDIYMAANSSQIQSFDQKLYEKLLVGINLFSCKFNSEANLEKFLATLENDSFKKNHVYYMSLIKYGTNLINYESVSVKDRYSFISSYYNEFKEKSLNDPSLAAHQYEIYSMVIYSLIDMNNINAATKILDNLILNDRSSNDLNNKAANEMNVDSDTEGSEKSFGSGSTAATSVESDAKGKNDLERVIYIYLSALSDVNFEQSVKLYKQFKSHNLISQDAKDDISRQFYIKFLSKACENYDIELGVTIFNEQFKSSSSLVPEGIINGSTVDKLSYTLFDSSSKVYTLSNAVSNYFALINNSHYHNDIPYFLTNASKSLFEQLSTVDLAPLIRYLGNIRVYHTSTFEFLDKYITLCGDRVDVNKMLTNLLTDQYFAKYVFDTDLPFRLLISSKFFKEALTNFSIKAYISDAEKAISRQNKFLGFIEVFHFYWNNCDKEAFQKNDMAVVEELEKILIDEFEDLDNFYLQKNLNKELIEKLSNSEQYKFLSAIDQTFYAQLNILNQFKLRLYQHHESITQE